MASTNYYMPKPASKSQNFDNLLLYNWQQDIPTSNSFEADPFFSPNDNLLDAYDYSKDWSNLDDFEFSLPSPLSPLEQDPDSPISSGSSNGCDELPQDMAVDPSVTCYDFCASPITKNEPSPLAISDYQAYDSPMPESSQPSKGSRALSPAEVQALYAIAMPELSLARSSNSSSASSPSPTIKEESPAPTPRPRHQTTKKQQQQQQSEKPKASTGGASKNKSTHNMIEKRYRNNLNSKITALSQCIPSLHNSTEGKASNKATILRKATEYIAELEQANKKLTAENTMLRSKISAFEPFLLSQTMARGMSHQRNYQAQGVFA